MLINVNKFASLISVPHAPSNVVVATNSASSLDVQWDPPEQMNGILQKYTVTYNGRGGGDNTTDTSATLTGLEACTEYTVTVTATNGAGTSEPSEPGTGETGVPSLISAT